MPCGECVGHETVFAGKAIERQLRRYRKHGPAGPTARLIAALAPHIDGDRSHLDIGAGIGALQHTLRDHGITRTLGIDGSRAHLQAAQEEAQRRGYAIEAHHGDAVDLAPTLPQADVVTMDYVLCCYSDMPALVDAAAGRTRHVLGITFPVRNLLTRLGARLFNLGFRLAGNPMRVAMHDPHAIHARLRSAGLEPVVQQRRALGLLWVYVRSSSPTGKPRS